MTLPTCDFDTAQVVYRHVNVEGYVTHRLNLYSVPWSYIGQVLPVRITESEVIIYSIGLEEIARHPLVPSTHTGVRRTSKSHHPGDDPGQRELLLRQRFTELGPLAVQFLDGLLVKQVQGKLQAQQLLALVAHYQRDDVRAAFERAVRFGAFSLAAVRRILAAHAKPKPLLDELADLHRETLDPLLRADAIGPRPTSDYQHLLLPEEAADDIPSAENPKDNPTKPTATPSLREQILADCATLRIPVTPDQLDAALSDAEKSGRSHLEFLHRLLTDQAGLRRQRSIERRIKDAHFRELKPLSDFDWSFNPSIPRTQIETLVACDFVRRCQNLVFVGQSGLGKSRLIQNIGQAACVQGYRVFYTTSGALLENLTAALADQTIHDRVRFYARFELLIIDEFGLDRIERSLCPQAASLWYKIIDARSQRVSTALVTNIDFESWAEYLGDAPLAMALLDRVVDGAIIVKLKGKSYRVHRGPDEDVRQVTAPRNGPRQAHSASLGNSRWPPLKPRNWPHFKPRSTPGRKHDLESTFLTFAVTTEDGRWHDADMKKASARHCCGRSRSGLSLQRERCGGGVKARVMPPLITRRNRLGRKYD